MRIDISLDDELRWQRILCSLDSIPDDGHDWDADPAEWVQRQRSADPLRWERNKGAWRAAGGAGSRPVG